RASIFAKTYHFRRFLVSHLYTARKASVDKPASSLFGRHDFLIRRLHSLTGLVPLGVYVLVHLAVNASVADGVAKYQTYVLGIHSLGGLLVAVEWIFVFIPLIFHTVIGLVIIGTGSPN